ncbi:MAG: glycosyltransferase family 4 protein [Pseudomonadota bacterium]
MNILHVVRRYGPVGGMERYVWELTRELQGLGHEITVVCERCHAEPPAGIVVHELGEMAKRPRWLGLLRFSRRVDRWLAAHPQPGRVIHSHERLACHDVTTFHGPPFATVRDLPWWRKVSLRVAMQYYLERRELRVARSIVPNSALIARQLAHYYPEYAAKLTAPVVPGVQVEVVRPVRCAPKQGGVVGFVGKEWRRKGLEKVIEIVARLRQTRPQIELRVVGPAAEELAPLFSDWESGYRLLGWQGGQNYLADFDVLLHPAKAEPYGMVITEAMAAQVPVVVSDVCGAAADVGADSGSVLSLASPVSMWANAVDIQLNRQDAPPRFVHGWDTVAREYETIYKK